MAVAEASMFFAGLILLIPHRIGMSRVNYVIKRYNLPISRAGLLLYKFHNPIEVSLTIGTLLGNIIVWVLGYYSQPKWYISILMIIFLFFMFFSSIYMFIIYIIGSDYGHLNSFYFSLILITLFDGFSNAFAFGLNAKEAAMLSAGIPTSGALVSLLHNIYKFFSDLLHWDNFDYYVLLIQLLVNILTLFITIILWAADYENHKDKNATVSNILELFNAGGGEDHLGDWFPICLLAISLGTVYAFYPSIAPYSIIDYQYASVIELWILCISAIPTLVIAILDMEIYKAASSNDKFKRGPSGNAKYKSTPSQNITGSDIKVKHSTHSSVKHPGDPGGENCPQTGAAGSEATTAHAYKSSGNYTLQKGDLYYDTNSGSSKPIIFSKTFILNNWFNSRTLTGGGGAENWNTGTTHNYWLWHLIWFCAIFYILCIQIFMSMLHYPDSLLSCFFKNNKYLVGFISVLFNTLRETMQACGFSGAGKQVINLTTSGSIYDTISISGTSNNDIRTFTGGNATTGGPPSSSAKLKLNLTISGDTFTDIKYIGDTSLTIKVPKTNDASINSTIAATNKLITLFVMMFCVFTGDGYLQHYRRCCRDCWPTTGYTRGQSFLIALTTTVKTQNIITNNVINLFVEAMDPLTSCRSLASGSASHL